MPNYHSVPLILKAVSFSLIILLNFFSSVHDMNSNDFLNMGTEISESFYYSAKHSTFVWKVKMIFTSRILEVYNKLKLKIMVLYNTTCYTHTHRHTHTHTHTYQVILMRKKC